MYTVREKGACTVYDVYRGISSLSSHLNMNLFTSQSH